MKRQPFAIFRDYLANDDPLSSRELGAAARAGCTRPVEREVPIFELNCFSPTTRSNR